MKYQLTLAGVSAAGSLLCLLSNGAAAQDIRFYRGDPASQSNVRITPWGSGDVRETEDHVFVGSKSLRITTHGRYQGAQIEFGQPLSLKSVLDDPTAFLQFTYLVQAKGTGGTSSLGGDYLGMMSGRGGAPGGGRGKLGGGGPGGEGGPGGTAGSDSNSRLVKPKPFSDLRIVLITTDDKRLETTLKLENAGKNRDEWSQIAVPVVALTGLKNSSAEIKDLLIFGNSPAVIYLGEASIRHDDTPIQVDELPEPTIAAGDTYPFTASAVGGASQLRYEWDFDTEDGTGVDAEGRSVKHKFLKARRDKDGNSIPFVVTLTVRDPYGIKKPVIKTTKVNVTL